MATLDKLEASLLLDIILQTSFDAIVICDNDYKIVSCNRSTDEMFGYKEEELIGMQVNKIIPAFKPSNDIHSKIYVTEGLKKDKTVFPIQTSAQSWRSDSEKGYCYVIRNIQTGKKTEKLFSKLNAEQGLETGSFIEGNKIIYYIKDNGNGFYIRFYNQLIDGRTCKILLITLPNKNDDSE